MHQLYFFFLSVLCEISSRQNALQMVVIVSVCTCGFCELKWHHLICTISMCMCTTRALHCIWLAFKPTANLVFISQLLQSISYDFMH